MRPGWCPVNPNYTEEDECGRRGGVLLHFAGNYLTASNGSHLALSQHLLSFLLGPFYRAIAVPSVTRSRCRRRRCCCCGHWRAAARSGEWVQHFSNASCLNVCIIRCTRRVHPYHTHARTHTHTHTQRERERERERENVDELDALWSLWRLACRRNSWTRRARATPEIGVETTPGRRRRQPISKMFVIARRGRTCHRRTDDGSVIYRRRRR